MDGQAFLRETAALIGCGWCSGADARDRDGAAVAASDSNATAWSLLCALVAISERPGADGTALRNALWGISGVIPHTSLSAWNDAAGRTQGGTLQMLAEAETNLDDHPPPDGGWSSPAF